VISSDHLDPGAVGLVKVTVTTENRSGPLLKHVTIYSNDRTAPVLSLEVTMDVVLKQP
jgi:hypothetical protein